MQCSKIRMIKLILIWRPFMFRMKNKLNNLYNANKEVKFALVGAGKMGKGLVNQLSRIKGLTSSVVIDEKPEKAMEALISSGVRKSDITTSDKNN